MALSKHKSHNYTTVQMVYWLSSVSSKQCQMRAPVRIPPGPILSNFFFTASDAGKGCLTCIIGCLKNLSRINHIVISKSHSDCKPACCLECSDQYSNKIISYCNNKHRQTLNLYTVICSYRRIPQVRPPPSVTV
jgi:hypothetical protein